MDRNFAKSLALVLRHEGGYVNHPSDPGGHTNKGITLATFRRYIKPNGTVADLKSISDEQVATCYRRHYWDAVKGDDLPDGIDYAVFDFAVNSGPARAAKYLQAVLGVAQDGAIGPITLAAARRANAVNVINRLCDDRLAFMKRITSGGKLLWNTFGRGWERRVAEVRAVSLEMAQNARPAPAKPSPAPTPSPTPQPALAPSSSGPAGIIGLILAALAAGAAIFFGMGD